MPDREPDAPSRESATLAFLRHALTATRYPAALAAAQAAAHGVNDGESLRALIERERIGPLLHTVLGASQTLSETTRAALRDAYRATAMRNLVLLHELGSSLQRLAAAGVEAIVLKGAALLLPLYGGLAMRPMADLDILIRREDQPRAQRVLLQSGFRLARLETHAGLITAHENELAFTKPGALTVDLDVHWSLFDSPFYQRQLAIEWFWQDARMRQLGGGVTARTLAPEALLLHLCAHLMLHHKGVGVLWWNDVAQLVHVEAERIDWNAVIDRSVANQLVLPVRGVLTALAAEWRVPVPDTVLQRLAAATPGAAEADRFRRLSGETSPLQRFWIDLRDMGDWRARLHYARSMVLPSPAFMRDRFAIRSAWLVPFYYPYRWLRALRGNLRRRRHG
ncbi:MAG: nucleotidyltransferase family protein [Deltaproteobacteria bacterium]|nr:nucleotidyltransferase family protein [Deltaproteobacteria bacterium]